MNDITFPKKRKSRRKNKRKRLNNKYTKKLALNDFDLQKGGGMEEMGALWMFATQDLSYLFLYHGFITPFWMFNFYYHYQWLKITA